MIICDARICTVCVFNPSIGAITDHSQSTQNAWPHLKFQLDVEDPAEEVGTHFPLGCVNPARACTEQEFSAVAGIWRSNEDMPIRITRACSTFYLMTFSLSATIHETLAVWRSMATKMITDLRDQTYEDRLRALHLTTLENRPIRGELKETFWDNEGSWGCGFYHDLFVVWWCSSTGFINPIQASMLY